MTIPHRRDSGSAQNAPFASCFDGRCLPGSSDGAAKRPRGSDDLGAGLDRSAWIDGRDWDVGSRACGDCRSCGDGGIVRAELCDVN